MLTSRSSFHFKTGEKLDFAFPPFSDDVSIYVNHPNAIDLLFKENAPLIKAFSGGLLQTGLVKIALKKKYMEWSEIAERSLPELQGIPRYRVTIGSSIDLPDETEGLDSSGDDDKSSTDEDK